MTGGNLFTSLQIMLTLEQIQNKYFSIEDQSDNVDFLLEKILPEFMIYTLMKVHNLQRADAIKKLRENDKNYREIDCQEILDDFAVLKLLSDTFI